MTRPPLTRWHIWSSPGSYHHNPEPVPRELWKRIRNQPATTSADGNWREIQAIDDNGKPETDEHDEPIIALVLVRYRPHQPTT